MKKLLLTVLPILILFINNGCGDKFSISTASSRLNMSASFEINETATMNAFPDFKINMADYPNHYGEIRQEELFTDELRFTDDITIKEGPETAMNPEFVNPDYEERFIYTQEGVDYDGYSYESGGILLHCMEINGNKIKELFEKHSTRPYWGKYYMISLCYEDQDVLIDDYNTLFSVLSGVNSVYSGARISVSQLTAMDIPPTITPDDPYYDLWYTARSVVNGYRITAYELIK